ncbi:MAG: GTPase/DUF3482 domain-containing protein [Phycisphaerales bacterium]|jgi:hypothetical protein|nr:GTPase/DUF3482 domain-containing protein [Phycisphaerales bacterium]
MSDSPQPLRIAVVGHANTGKTSLLQTLLRRRDFGIVSPTGGTTRSVTAGEILDEEEILAVILDTPGLEDSIRLRNLIESSRTDRREDPRTLLDRFLASPAASDSNELALEASSLQAAMNADVLLYAIDARDEPQPRHLDELAVLGMTARPLIPLLNFTARPEADADSWRDACARQGLHATVSFDAIVFDDAGEARLLDAIRTLAPTRSDAIDAWRRLRESERTDAIAGASEIAADFLIDAAAAIIVTEPASREVTDRENAFGTATTTLLDGLREHEARSMHRIADIFGFSGQEADAALLEITDAMGGVDFAGNASLERAGLWAAGAGTGLVAAGAIVDLAVGGISLGGFTALGAVGAAIGAIGGSGSKILRRLRGQDEVRIGETGLTLLHLRQRATIDAFLKRGHAAIEPARIETTVSEALTARSDDDAGKLLTEARGHPTWSRLSKPDEWRGGRHARASLALRIATSMSGHFDG